jgi:predicted ATPase/transcriptional regulator with XRE-family HTH domain
MPAHEIVTFGSALKRYRERARLTQEELAERAGLSAAAVSALERGVRRLPQPATIRQLADALELIAADRATVLDLARSTRPSEEPLVLAAFSPLLAPPTPLIGRARAEAEIVDLLRQPGGHSGPHLVTLTGPGGVGKTRLALQVLDALRGFYPDGTVTVSLAPLNQASLVPSAIERALGLRQADQRPVEERLLAFLRPRALLLVLDNFEHLLDAAPLLARLIAACPNLRLLVTSRAPLRVQGEQEFFVPPLDVPARGVADPAKLSQCSAVTLFVDRARAVRRDFTLDPATAGPVAEICRRLDGLPLAIELAAARTRLLSPAALLARLDRPLAVLASGGEDRPARQRTLGETIAWSYHLLKPAEQRLFRRLAVFAGGGAYDAVEQICKDDGSDGDLLDGLDSLVGWSLLRSDKAGEIPRVVLLETIREYALAELDRSGEADALRQRHAAHYVQYAVDADRGICGPQQLAWLARLESEYDNLQAVLTWAGDAAPGSERAELGARLIGALGWWWFITGRAVDGRRWAEAALADAPTIDTPGLARAAVTAAFLAYDCLDLESSGRWAEAVDEHSDLLDAADRVVVALCRYAGGQKAGDSEAQSHALLNLRAIADGGDGLWAKAFAKMADGEIARLQADFDHGQALHAASARLFQETGDAWMLAAARHNQGSVAARLGDSESAESFFAEALELGKNFDGGILPAYCLDGLAGIASARGDGIRAARLLGAADHLFAAMGNDRQVADRQDYDDAVAATKALLGDEAYFAAWAEGHALSLDAAIESALVSDLTR